jgi:hypothetical protein
MAALALPGAGALTTLQSAEWTLAPRDGPPTPGRHVPAAVVDRPVCECRHAFAAFSRDAGWSFRIDDPSSSGRVEIAMSGRGAVAATRLEVVHGCGTVELRLADQTGSRSPPAIAATGN